jgi:hypothetical protein
MAQVAHRKDSPELKKYDALGVPGVHSLKWNASRKVITFQHLHQVTNAPFV